MESASWDSMFKIGAPLDISLNYSKWNSVSCDSPFRLGIQSIFYSLKMRQYELGQSILYWRPAQHFELRQIINK